MSALEDEREPPEKATDTRIEDPRPFRLLLDFDNYSVRLEFPGNNDMESVTWDDLPSIKKIHRGLGLLIAEAEPTGKLIRRISPAVQKAHDEVAEEAGVAPDPLSMGAPAGQQRRFDLQVPGMEEENSDG